MHALCVSQLRFVNEYKESVFLNSSQITSKAGHRFEHLQKFNGTHTRRSNVKPTLMEAGPRFKTSTIVNVHELTQ